VAHFDNFFFGEINNRSLLFKHKSNTSAKPNNQTGM